MPGRIVIDGRPISDLFPGIGRYVFNLVRALPGATDEPLVVLLDRRAPQTRFATSTLADAGLEIVFADGDPRSLRGVLHGRRLGRSLSPSLLHATYPLTPAVARCPRVVSMYDLIPLRMRASIPSLPRRWLYRRLLRRGLRQAASVIAISQTSKQDLLSLPWVEQARVTVAPPAPDPSFGPVDDHHVEALRERLGLPRRYALFVGSDRPHKNLSGLLAAWRCLLRLGGEAHHLVIAGSGYAARRSAAVHPDPRVVALGRVDEQDLPALYTGATVLVQPSLWEGVGLPVLEAMACGVPVACSAVPGLTETAAGAALSFDPRDPSDMASVVAEILTSRDLREELAARGRERVAGLSWQETARRTAETYRRVQA